MCEGAAGRVIICVRRVPFSSPAPPVGAGCDCALTVALLARMTADMTVVILARMTAVLRGAPQTASVVRPAVRRVSRLLPSVSR